MTSKTLPVALDQTFVFASVALTQKAIVRGTRQQPWRPTTTIMNYRQAGWIDSKRGFKEMVSDGLGLRLSVLWRELHFGACPKDNLQHPLFEWSYDD